MIAYSIVLLTEMDDIEEAPRIQVRCGTGMLSVDGAMVREFVKCTNHAYHDYPYYDCLTVGLALIPSELRSIFEYLYETLREVFVWNEEGQF